MAYQIRCNNHHAAIGRGNLLDLDGQWKRREEFLGEFRLADGYVAYREVAILEPLEDSRTQVLVAL